MTKVKLMIVEDDPIIAEWIGNSLKKLDFEITAIISSGEEVIEAAEKNIPDLVLMDISLKGKTNVIEAADQIRSLFDIPIIYLTAYSDKETLQRAKITEPFGYIIKPFKDKELQTIIEAALYKHKTEKMNRKNEQWVSTILRSIGDAVMVSDMNGNITFMNPVACALTAWTWMTRLANPWMMYFILLMKKLEKLLRIL